MVNDILKDKKVKIIFGISYAVNIILILFGIIVAATGEKFEYLCSTALLVYPLMAIFFIVYDKFTGIREIKTKEALLLIVLFGVTLGTRLVLSMLDIEFTMLFLGILSLVEVLTLSIYLKNERKKKHNRKLSYFIGIASFIVMAITGFVAEFNRNAITNSLLSLTGFTCLIRGVIYMLLTRSRKVELHPEAVSIFRKVITATHCLEILSGLLAAIVIVSIILPFIEEGIPTFGDAMWYCFTLVTTIGFGDLVCATSLGRIISVILGIYGVVIVALFTGVIASYYNEVKEKEAKMNNKK